MRVDGRRAVVGGQGGERERGSTGSNDDVPEDVVAAAVGEHQSARGDPS